MRPKPATAAPSIRRSSSSSCPSSTTATLIRRACVSAALALAAACSSSPAHGPEAQQPPVPTPPSILSPAPDSALKAKKVQFSWSAGADDTWLRVGTKEGAADLYESPHLGTATSHLVTGLPLSGADVFVELGSRIGDQSFTTRARYTAAFRRGLALIVDFADARLEDWTGDGFKSEQDLRDQLTDMEKHWTWASHGKEVAHWDIERVAISEKLEEDAFPSHDYLRDRVIGAARATLNLDAYDVDADGILDGVWIVVPNLGHEFGWLVGGETRDNNANTFVDGQSGGSVTGHQTGNFNHEFGHCMGLPDLYGPFGTVVNLTLMASSWDQPPNDFSAFDRYRLGWLEAREVTETTRGIVLRSSTDSMDGVVVRTSRSAEFFLLEYRKRPADGYDSQGPKFDGLVVLHAFDRSTQKLNPPLLKTEPVDGAITPDTAPELDDLLYPGNPKMQLPFAVKTYAGGEVAFEIDNVQWAPDGAGIQFDVIVHPTGNVPNLLANASFDSGSEQWSPYATDPSVVFGSDADGHTGGASGRSVTIESRTEYADAAWTQRVHGLEAGRPYLVCGWMKGEAVEPLDPTGQNGASVTLLSTYDPNPGGMGTFGWTQFCTAFEIPQAADVDVACRLGTMGAPARGKVWCDDLTLTPLNRAYGAN